MAIEQGAEIDAGTAAKASATSDTGGGDAPWFEAFDDPDLKAVAEKKGWKSPMEAVRSYRHAEQLIGGRMDGVIEIPDDTDLEGRKAIYAKLGASDDLEAYQPPADLEITGGDAALQNMRELAAEFGVPVSRFPDLVQAVESHAAAQAEIEEQAMSDEIDQAERNLQREWGKDYAAKAAAGNQAALKLGVSEDEMYALQGSLGVERVLRLFSQLGEEMGADTVVGLDGATPGGDVRGKAAAQRELERLTADKDFQKAMFDPSNPLYRRNNAKWTELQEIAFS